MFIVSVSKWKGELVLIAREKMRWRQRTPDKMNKAKDREKRKRNPLWGQGGWRKKKPGGPVLGQVLCQMIAESLNTLEVCVIILIL